MIYRNKLSTLLVILVLFLTVACDSGIPEEPIEFPPAPDINYAQTYGQLQVSDGRLRDESGNPVQLKGMGTYWLNWENGRKYANEDVVATLSREWGVSVLRIAMGVNPGDGSGYIRPENRGELEEMVHTLAEACIKYGIYFIIDWHSYETLYLGDEESEFFTMIAEEYGETPNLLYELYNEPGQFEDWSRELKPYQENLVQNVIRPIDPDNVIIIGSRAWDQHPEECADDPVSGTNLMYSIHFYAAGHVGDMGAEMRTRFDYAIAKGLVLFATEWGTSHYDWNIMRNNFDESDIWIDWMEENGVGWANFSISDMTESASALRPGASVAGHWSSLELSRSGIYIRWKLLE